MLSLLFLIPPSYMVVPKNLGNIFSSTSAISSTIKQMTSLPALGVMDIDIFTINNYDNVRRRKMSPIKTNLRTASMSLSILSKPYHEKIEHFNNLSDEEFREPVNSFQLSYNNNRREENQVSKTTDQETRAR